MIYYLVEATGKYGWWEYGIITATSNKDAKKIAKEIFPSAYNVWVTRINELDFDANGYHYVTER